MKRDIKQLKEEMTAAGFRATPFAYIVWTIRRMLWPFLRQYHFLQLEKFVEAEELVTEGLHRLTVRSCAVAHGRCSACQPPGSDGYRS